MLVKGESTYTSILGMMVDKTLSYCCLVLFLGLTWLVSMSIQMIAEQVKNAVAMTDDATDHQLRKWKKSYFLTLDLIEEMDGFFGPILLAIIAQMFLLIITHIYFAFCKSNENRLYGNIGLIRHYYKIIVTLIWMFLLTFGTQRIKKKVTLLF